METVFRLFMFIFPYAVSIALYIWILKKAWRVPHKLAKVVATTLVIAGLGYTLFKLATSVSRALTDDRFEYAILIITIFVLFFASIAMALGQPEKQ